MSEMPFDLTTSEKIALIEASGLPVAWDECHKIYFLEDDGRREDAENHGYEIFPAAKIREMILESCSLVLVSRWGYDNDDFDHPWNIRQGTEDIYAAAEGVA